MSPLVRQAGLVVAALDSVAIGGLIVVPGLLAAAIIAAALLTRVGGKR